MLCLWCANCESEWHPASYRCPNLISCHRINYSLALKGILASICQRLLAFLSKLGILTLSLHEIRQTRLKTLPFVCQELGKTNTSYHYLSFCSILSVSSVNFDSHNTIRALLCYAQFFSFFLNAKQPMAEDYSGRKAMLWRESALSPSQRLYSSKSTFLNCSFSCIEKCTMNTGSSLLIETERKG